MKKTALHVAFLVLVLYMNYKGQEISMNDLAVLMIGLSAARIRN